MGVQNNRLAALLFQHCKPSSGHVEIDPNPISDQALTGIWAWATNELNCLFV